MAQIQIPIPNMDFWYKGLVFCRNDDWFMEKNMDKGLTVPKWALINQPKIAHMPQNSSVQIVCQSLKVWDFDEKRLHWVSVVCDWKYGLSTHECVDKVVYIAQVLNSNDLLLICTWFLKISSSRNWFFELDFWTWFFVYFKLNFYCLCSLQKSSLK